MPKLLLEILVDYCDRLLKIDEFDDWPGAHNGLQAENRQGVTRIAAAVDASLATVERAIEAQADLLLVHHGLFWSAKHPWKGHHYRLLRALLDSDLAVYSAHLPLDVHPVYGNNACLAQALEWRNPQEFFAQRGRNLGIKFETQIGREILTEKLNNILRRSPALLPGGPEICQSVGIVTGGAGAELQLAANEGVDTFITGEGPHWTYAMAEETGINVFYGGHYATETFGVKALAEHLAEKFELTWCFIDHPTGL